jgi:microcystin-dependent protein
VTLQPPQYLQDLAYPARHDRQMLADVFSQGVVSTADLLVTSTGAALSVSVASGSAYVYGTQSAGQGAYRCSNNGAVTIAIAAAATFPRVDQIVVRVYDKFESGSISTVTVENVQGAESSGATLANRSGAASSLPANSFVLADVLVPVGSGQVIPVNNINDRRTFASFKSAGAAPIGASMPYDGTGDPGNGWVLRDGRLIDKTRYALYFAAVGHAYNGGVDPGSNKVRISDGRGRVSVGADNMGSAQGAAGRLTANGTRGASGGEEKHALIAGENAPHTHDFYADDFSLGAGGVSGYLLGDIVGQGSALHSSNPGGAFGIANSGSGTAHNNMQPFETTNWIVRIA